MEIAIKKAYRLRGCSPPDVISRLIDLRREYLLKCADMTVEVLDLDLNKPINFPKLGEMIETAMETGAPGHLDFSASAVVYFQDDATYVELLRFDDELIAIINSQWEDADDYAYSAIMDKPEAVTDVGWKEREKVWTQLRGEGLSPKESGLSYDLAEPGDAPMIALMVSSRSCYG